MTKYIDTENGPRPISILHPDVLRDWIDGDGFRQTVFNNMIHLVRLLREKDCKDGIFSLAYDSVERQTILRLEIENARLKINIKGTISSREPSKSCIGCGVPVIHFWCENCLDDFDPGITEG